MGDPIRLEQEEAEQIEKALQSFYGVCVTAHQEHLCTTALSLLAAARERGQSDADTYPCGHSRNSDAEPLACPLCAREPDAHFKPLPETLPLAPETQIASGYSYDLRGLEPALERAREPAKDTARPVIGPWGVTLPESEKRLLWEAIEAHTKAKTWDDRTSAAIVIGCRMDDLVRAALGCAQEGEGT